MLNVTCTAAAVAPSVAPIGLVNSVQTYCGLEIAIMQIRPSPSCTHRALAIGKAAGRTVALIMAPGEISAAPCNLGASRHRWRTTS